MPPQMLIHQVPRRLRLSRRQKIDEQGVLLDGAGRRVPIVEKDGERRLGGELLNESLEKAVLAEGGENGMELREQLDEAPAVARRLRLDLPLEVTPQRADVVGGAVAAKVVDDLAFDQPTRRISLLNLRQRGIRDEGAAVSLHLDDPRAGKAPQRLADDGAPDAELRRERELAEFLSRLESFADNQRGDGVRHAVVHAKPMKEPSHPKLARIVRRPGARAFRRLAGSFQHFQDGLRREVDSIAAMQRLPEPMNAEALVFPQIEDQRFLALEHLPVGRRSGPSARVLEPFRSRKLVAAPPFSERRTRNAKPGADRARVSGRLVGFHPAHPLFDRHRPLLKQSI